MNIEAPGRLPGYGRGPVSGRQTMPRPSPLRIVSRPRLFFSLTRLDWFALYLATASVLLFATSMLIAIPGPESASNSPSLQWIHAHNREAILNRSLLVFLALEILLLLWLWVEFPRRRRTEAALRKMHSLQRAIARSSARMVSMKPEEIEAGLHAELCGIREMLGVDRICWFQQSADGGRFLALQTAGGADDARQGESFSAATHPWLADAILRGLPVHVRSLADMPAAAEVDRQSMAPSGVKSLATIPSTGGAGPANALMLTSFSREIDWDEEVIAQLSVLASVFANAHARKLAQDAGTESELRFRHLFEEAPIGCCLVNAKGQICVANPALTAMLGYSSEELTGKAFWEITAEPDIAKSLIHFQELMAGVRDFYQLEKRYLKNDATVIWGRLTVSLLGARSEDGQFVLAMVEDVTEAVRAREQLEQSRRRLTLALEASRMTAWDYDPETETISWVDRNTLRHSGHKPEGPAEFHTVLAYVHPGDRATLLELAARIMKEGGAFTTEFRMFGKDGTTRWMLGKGELLRRGPGEKSRIAGVTIDVSELKRTQIELQQLAKRLMEAQEEERRRISRELHDDIGQRVALLSIELDLLAKQIEKGQPLKERVERAQAATGELGSDLHQLSHALHSSKLQYLGLPSALRELCGRMAEKHSLTIEFACDEEKLTLAEDDALALFRVAQEALNNVVRHSNATAAKVALARVEAGVRLGIFDDGRGFEPGSRSGGIGLVGMRERLRAVGGEFQIISAPGAGTEIHATVGLAAGKARAGRQMSAGSAP
jgi:PAS domain S-box-containing protein